MSTLSNADPLESIKIEDNNKSKDNRRETKASLLPTLEEILYDERLEPFTRENLRLFLKSEYSQENLNFFLAVSKFEKDFGSIRIRGDIPNVPEEDSDPMKFAENIINIYVKSGSEEEVNIEASQREQVLDHFEKIKKGELELNANELFKVAKDEVVLLMSRDTFPRFRYKVLSENLNASETGYRWIAFVILLVLTLLGLGLMIAYCVNEAYALLTFFMWVMAYDYFFAARNKLCAQKAFSGQRMIPTASWFVARYSPSCDVPIEDEYARVSFRKLAVKQLIKIFVTSMIFTGLCIAIPFIVQEAAGTDFCLN